MSLDGNTSAPLQEIFKHLIMGLIEASKSTQCSQRASHNNSGNKPQCRCSLSASSTNVEPQEMSPEAIVVSFSKEIESIANSNTLTQAISNKSSSLEKIEGTPLFFALDTIAKTLMPDCPICPDSKGESVTVGGIEIGI